MAFSVFPGLHSSASLREPSVLSSSPKASNEQLERRRVGFQQPMGPFVHHHLGPFTPFDKIFRVARQLLVATARADTRARLR